MYKITHEDFRPLDRMDREGWGGAGHDAAIAHFDNQVNDEGFSAITSQLDDYTWRIELNVYKGLGNADDDYGLYGVDTFKTKNEAIWWFCMTFKHLKDTSAFDASGHFERF